MRKIDKSQQLSTIYKAWEKGYEDSNTPHPSYSSKKTKDDHYKDIVMDALRCQKGLCAYTEVQLCPTRFLTPENWEEGRYKGNIEGRIHNGELEHFDERLKFKDKKKEEKEGKKKKVKKAIEPKNDENIIYEHKDWLWSNFFVTDSDTNRRKWTKPVDYILKPDLENYDPFKLMEYSNETHIYCANSELPEAEIKRIDDMIEILGLNFPNLHDRRGKMVEYIIKHSPTSTEYIDNQFPTAVEFYKRNQNS